MHAVHIYFMIISKLSSYLKSIRQGEEPLHGRLVNKVIGNQKQVTKYPGKTHHCNHGYCIHNTIYDRSFFGSRFNLLKQ